MPGFLLGPITGFVDRMKGKGMCSSSFLQQIGKGAALSAGGGSINFQSSVAGVGNGADVTADTLYQAIIPPNTFDIPGRSVWLQCSGVISATSATKTLAFVWGGGSLNQQIIQYTTTNGGTFQFNVIIWKISNNVQGALFQADGTGTIASLLGGGAVARSTVQTLTGSETDTAAITMKVTGQSSVATANLVVLNMANLDAYN
jgi:hypothetical protein